jgi:hypothetical protein
MPRKQITTTIDADLLKKLKQLALDLDCRVNDLIEDAVNHFYFPENTKTDTTKKQIKPPKK